MNLTGACIYCGQLANFSSDEALTPEQENHEATLRCSCDEAKHMQQVEASIVEEKQDIKELFEEYPDIQSLLNGAVELIARRTMEKISISKGKLKANITISAKGELKVEKIRTLKEARTI